MVLPLTLRLALVDPGAARVGNLGGAEGRFKILRECQHDLMWRRRHGAADQRTGMIEEGVGPRRDGCESDEQSDRRMRNFRMAIPQKLSFCGGVEGRQ